LKNREQRTTKKGFEGKDNKFRAERGGEMGKVVDKLVGGSAS